MVKTLKTPSNSLQLHSKDKHFQNQFRTVFNGFYRQPLTMMELSILTGIDRANICRYCREMRIAGKIAVVKKAVCSITKHWANKYTTNPEMFPKSNQIKLF